MNRLFCGKTRYAAFLAAGLAALLLGAGVFRVLTHRTIRSAGEGYEIAVTYGPSARIPARSALDVQELTGARLTEYYERARLKLGAFDAMRAFDIRCVAEDGTEIEPSAPVQVDIRLAGSEGETMVSRVLHFTGDGQVVAPVLPGAAVNGTDGYYTLGFETDSFSVYAVTQVLLEKTITAGDGNTYQISVTYDGGAGLPADASLSVSEISGERFNEYAEMAAEAMDTSVLDELCVFDIAIVDSEGTSWQPDQSVTVTVELSGSKTPAEAVSVVHFGDEAEVLESKKDGNTVTFRTDGFSVYALGSNHLRTYRFFTCNSSEDMRYVEYLIYTDAGTTTYTQTVRNGAKSLVVPQLPSLPGNETSTFAGWFPAEDVTTEDGVFFDYGSISDEPFDFDNIPEVTKTETVCLFARFSDYAYVIFHDQWSGSTGTFPVAKTRRGEKKNGVATVPISDFSITYESDGGLDMAFYGWSETAVQEPGAQEGLLPRIETDTIDIRDTTHLYPLFLPVHWLSFNSGPAGSNATYITASYHFHGEGPDKLAVPVWSGYSFVGWFTELDANGVPAGTQVADALGNLVEGAAVEGSFAVSGGSLHLNQSVTLYAKWTEAPVQYSVVFWRQKATDSPDLPDADKTYDYAETLTFQANTGSAVSVLQADKEYGGTGEYTGFHFGRCDDSKTVAANGSTVLNVYYDRNRHTLTFRRDRYNYAMPRNVYLKDGHGNYRRDAFGNYQIGTVQSFLTLMDSYYETITWVPVATITALYGASIVDSFPVVGTDGTAYSGYSWQQAKGTTPVVYEYILATIDTMPDADVVFDGEPLGTVKVIHYYVEISREDYEEESGQTGNPPTVWNVSGDLDEKNAAPFVTFSGKLYRYHKSVRHNFVYITYDEEYHPLEGYVQDRENAIPSFHEAPYANNANMAPLGGKTTDRTTKDNINYLFYDRDRGHTISFLDSYTNESAYIGGAAQAAAAVPFSERIRGYVPQDNPEPMMKVNGSMRPREGYSFTGWYADASCSTRVFFEDNEAYRNYTRPKVLYERMPNHSLRVYAGWEENWYMITIDPGGGDLHNVDQPEHGSTWYWEKYNGDPVEEYIWATRDYVESMSGTYYYHYDDRSTRYAPGWQDEEADDEQRYAYYTENLDEATNLTTYRHAQNAYRYAGWYERDPDTGKETLYDFSAPITHDLYLVLHWKKTGTYFVEYNADTQVGETRLHGTLDDGDSNEQLFVELDGDDYADRADVVVTRTAKAPEGYNFIGWRVRGDTSGQVYYPGGTFSLRAAYTATVNGRETIYLDAVYTRIETAKIIYDANSGEIYSEPDYGGPVELDAGAAQPRRSYDAEQGTAVIENLVNNTAVKLSDGTGFRKDKGVLVGWSATKDASTLVFDPGGDGETGNYYVDTEKPVELYAVWELRVYYHLNNSSGAAWGTGWPPEGFTRFADDVYYQTVYINNPVSRPPINPEYKGTEDLMFHYWSTESLGSNIQPYDFSTPVTDELHLFAYWAGPLRVPVHAADSSQEIIADRDEAWLTQKELKVGAEPVSLATAADAAACVNVDPAQYEFAFAAVKSSTSSNGLQDLSEADAVTGLYFNSEDDSVYVRYRDAGRNPRQLSGQDAVYFIYYARKELRIGYKEMDTDKTLKNIVLAPSASPPERTGLLGSYDMREQLAAPKTYPDSAVKEYSYFSFALGAEDTGAAMTDADLIFLTTSATDDAGRPAMQVKNSWRGFRYSTDGTSWSGAGYSPQLYVIYFEYQPVVVSLSELTRGLESDMDKLFQYKVEVKTVKETVRQTVTRYQTRQNYNSEWSDVKETEVMTAVTASDPFTTTSTFRLANNEKRTITLFYVDIQGEWFLESYGYNGDYRYDANYARNSLRVTSTMTVTQDSYEKDGFKTNHNGTGDSHTSDYVLTWTTDGRDAGPDFYYTNTRTPFPLALHVAMVGSDGTVTLDDNDRNTEKYTLDVPIDSPASESNTKTFLDEIPYAELFRGDAATYGFAGVFLGSGGQNQGDAVTLEPAKLTTVTYGNIRESIYEVFFNGDKNLQKDKNTEVYYLYYPLPQLVYVKEAVGGALSPVRGSVDGSSETDALTYNRDAFTLNGVAVAQHQLLPVGDGVLTIRQTVDGSSFNMPPRLDDGTDPLYLHYAKLGVAGRSDAATRAELEMVTENQLLYLKIEENRVRWSADGSTWNAFAGNKPTVYAIYKEIGYELEIRKTLADDTGHTAAESFTVTVRSPFITGTSYSVAGTGYNTIDAVPAAGSVPGSIVLTMKDGSDITIGGLPRGVYTVTEEGNENYILTAQLGPPGGELSAAEVTDNASAEVELSANRELLLTNTRALTEVTVEKYLEDSADPNLFTFAAAISDNGSAVAGKTFGEDDARTETDAVGLVVFELRQGEKRTLTVPAGANLDIIERSASDGEGGEIPLSNYTTTASAQDAGEKSYGHYSGDRRTLTLSSVPGTAVTVTFVNNSGKEVRFRKVDSFGKPLPGAVFAVYDSYEHAAAGGDEGRLVLRVGDAPAESVTSDAAGEVVFKVKNGVSYLCELSAPAGYEKSADIYRLAAGIAGTEVDGITLPEDAEFLIRRMLDAETEDGKSPDVAAHGITNAITAKRRVLLRKTDELLAPLAGAEFELLRSDMSLFSADSSHLTASGEDGVYFAGVLPYGYYFLHETAYPGGVRTNGAEGWWFTLRVDEDGVTMLSTEPGAEPLIPEDFVPAGADETPGGGDETPEEPAEPPEEPAEPSEP